MAASNDLPAYPPRIPLARRAAVGAAWALAWMLAWGAALLLFPHPARAGTLSLAVPDGPVSLPVTARPGLKEALATAAGCIGELERSPRAPG